MAQMLVSAAFALVLYNVNGGEILVWNRFFNIGWLIIPVNMAGLPGLNIPIGFDKNHMPIGMQIIGNAFEEAKIYQLASILEKELDLDLNPNGGEQDD